MIFGYIRISTDKQILESQKNIVSRYCADHRLLIDQWFEIEASSRKSTFQRRIDELIDQLNEADVVIASEISRLGRSIKEVLHLIETIVVEKKCRLILIKQNLDISHTNKNSPTNKILITMFSMLAELERDFISERTKEGLASIKKKGIQLGKPKGTIQKSMYDEDLDRISHLHSMGVGIQTMIDTHLGYGKYLSLKNFIEKKVKKNFNPVGKSDQICR